MGWFLDDLMYHFSLRWTGRGGGGGRLRDEIIDGPKKKRKRLGKDTARESKK